MCGASIRWPDNCCAGEARIEGQDTFSTASREKICSEELQCCTCEAARSIAQIRHATGYFGARQPCCSTFPYSTPKLALWENAQLKLL
jgi:hypothetical protein